MPSIAKPREPQAPAKRSTTTFLLCLALGLAASLPAVAEEIALKDGTKIVGHMTGITSDKIEVETSYGKVQLNRKDIWLSISRKMALPALPSQPPKRRKTCPKSTKPYAAPNTSTAPENFH